SPPNVTVTTSGWDKTRPPKLTNRGTDGVKADLNGAAPGPPPPGEVAAELLPFGRCALWPSAGPLVSDWALPTSPYCSEHPTRATERATATRRMRCEQQDSFRDRRKEPARFSGRSVETGIITWIADARV